MTTHCLGRATITCWPQEAAAKQILEPYHYSSRGEGSFDLQRAVPLGQERRSSRRWGRHRARRPSPNFGAKSSLGTGFGCRQSHMEASGRTAMPELAVENQSRARSTLAADTPRNRSRRGFSACGLLGRRQMPTSPVCSVRSRWARPRRPGRFGDAGRRKRSCAPATPSLCSSHYPSSVVGAALALC